MERRFTVWTNISGLRIGNEGLDRNGLGLTGLVRDTGVGRFGFPGAAEAVGRRRAGAAQQLIAPLGPPAAVEEVDASVAREGHEDKEAAHRVEDDVNEGEDHAGHRRHVETGGDEGEDPGESHDGRHAGVEFQLAQGPPTPGTLALTGR